ncbi:MAG: GAK system CofD-like protein [Marinomonas sp.]
MPSIWRKLQIPDPIRIGRSQKMPELGPRILFFSGGSALNKISRSLKNYTHNSIHLVTPFDSGGSSAKLRDEFNMPAVGDIRSRLMALADETVLGQPDVYDLFHYRLNPDQDNQILRQELQRLESGEHPFMTKITSPLKELIQTQLSITNASISQDFDLRGASIGNLIIAGGYLNNEQKIDPIIFLFSRLVKVLGEVKTITDTSHHMVTLLENGESLVGQHRMTGKECGAISSAVKEIYLTQNLISSKPAVVKLGHDRHKMIQDADLICYPPGSFYSSVLINLVPEGVAEAILANPNPKIYIPNLGNDPEQYGLTLLQQVETIIRFVHKGENEQGSLGALDFLLIDEKLSYTGLNEIEALGVTIIRADIADEKAHKYHENKLSEALISIL